MSPSNMRQRRAALLAAHMSANDARLAKQAAALETQGYVVDFLSWEGATGPYPSLHGARLLPWRRANSLPFGKLLPGLAKRLFNAASQRHALEAALIAGQYDVVISSDPETLRPAAQAKQRGGYGLMYDAHEYYPDEVPNDAPRSAWVKRVHIEAGPQLDAFTSVNRAICDLYAQTSPELGHAKVVANASPSRPLPQDDGRLRARLGVAASNRILLFQGGLARDRGLHALVDAMDDAPPNWVAVLMGSGALDGALRQRAGKRVIFIEPQKWDELHLWTAGADLGAVLYEGTCANQRLCSPNKLWEYPAAGVPLLASDLPFLGKMVSQHDIGICVREPVTAHAISQTLVQVTPQNLAAWRENAMEFSRNHSWETEAATFVAEVNRAASKARPDRPILAPHGSKAR
jgi:glycosyltransferase involved in cell wall biosynthesis